MRFALLLSVAAISLAGPVCAADEKQESIGQPTEVKASPDLKISEKEAQDMLRKDAKAGASMLFSGGRNAHAYPETRKVDVVEEQFGVKIADPYRWLEDDVRVNPEVAKWVEAQNRVSNAYLDTLPGRDALTAVASVKVV